MTSRCVQAYAPVPLNEASREAICDHASLHLEAHHAHQLDALIEAIPGCALLVDERDRVVHMNSQASRLLLEERHEVTAALRSARDCRVHHGMTVTRLRGVSAGHLLIVLAASDAERAVRAARTWGATPKQLRVLELLAEGKCNKDIGAALGCAEVTVEKHLTRLFQRSGTRSRVELVTQLARL